MRNARWIARLVALMVAAICAIPLGAQGEAKAPTLPELMQNVHLYRNEMRLRDRSADSPIYKIDAERFVSNEDVAAYVHVIALNLQVKMHSAEGVWDEAMWAAKEKKIMKSQGASITDFLIAQMLTEAEAEALGIENLEQSLKHYMRYGDSELLDMGELMLESGTDMDGLKKKIEEQMEQPEATPEAPDTETLVREGWVRAKVALGDFESGGTSKLAYPHHETLINELIESLKLKYPSAI